jgi:hypothetical protein
MGKDVTEKFEGKIFEMLEIGQEATENSRKMAD